MNVTQAEMTSAELAERPPAARVDLVFVPNGNRVRVPSGVTVFDAASWNGVAIDSTCGGHGTCKKCKVRVSGGSIPASSLDARAFSPDELRDGWRLACRAAATSDLTIEVPPLTTRPKAATVGVGRQVILRPAVQKRYLELAEPSLADQRSDIERVLDGLDDLELRVDLAVLRTLGQVLRAADYKVTAVVVDEALIDVQAGDTTGRRYGIAFDLGTTTVVATLLDLSTGTPMAVSSMLSKQQPFGADVISRISAVMMDPDNLGRLATLAHESLGELVGEVCEQAGIDPLDVYEVALAGNATMTHLALGIDPEPLGVAPFILSARLLPEVLASDLGLSVHPRARAVVFPAFGAYVGGDITAGLLAVGDEPGRQGPAVHRHRHQLRDRARQPRLAAGDGRAGRARVRGGRDQVRDAGRRRRDRGRRARRQDAAGAATPASPAGTGGGVSLKVIGDCEPAGLCGSGLVDAVASLIEAGLLDHSGRFVPDEAAAAVAPGLAARLTMLGDERVFVLHWAGEPGDVGALHLSYPTGRAGTAVRQGGHRVRVERPARGGQPDRRRCPAGAAGRVVRQLPVARKRDQARAGAETAGTEGGQRRERSW